MRRRAVFTRRHAFSLIEIMVVIVLMMTLFAILLPAIQQAREMARRTGCRSKIMQLGLALQNYHASHRVLPPGSVNSTGPIKTEDAGYHVGWIVQLLPYIDQRNTYNHFDFSVGVYAAANLPARTQPIDLLQCLSDPNFSNYDIGHSSYAGCHHHTEAPIGVDNHGVLFLNSRVRLKEVTDGVSNTIFVGERKLTRGFELGWASGTRATLRNTGAPINTPVSIDEYAFGEGEQAVEIDLATATAVGGFSSWHMNGCHFVFGDGAVRFLNNKINPQVYSHLADRADGTLPGKF